METEQENVETTENATEEAEVTETAEETTVAEVVEEQPANELEKITISESSVGSVSYARNGKASFCFITTGKGSSGYYPEETLRKAAPLLEGAPMHVDHLKNNALPKTVYWVGDITSAQYDSNGIDGPGIYGTATVFPRWKEFVEGMIDSRGGVSIKALGNKDKQNVITEISAVDSVDYVVRAGRGGRVTQLLESAIALNHDEESEENTMDGTEVQEKQAGVETTTEESPSNENTNTTNVAESASNESTSVDMKAIEQMFTTVLESKLKTFESRLNLIESETSDRDKVAKAVREAAGEDLTEDMCKHIENVVWQFRGEGVDLEERAKTTVETLKPVMISMKEEADKKIEEARKESTAKKNVPAILEHMKDVHAGKDGEELSEEDLEKALAKSIANVVDTKDVETIQETIINSRGD